MDQVAKQAEELLKQVDAACERLKIDELSAELEDKQVAATHPDFWEDSAKAQEVMKQTSKLEARVLPWVEIRRTASDLRDLAKLGDESLEAELTRQLESAEKAFERLFRCVCDFLARYISAWTCPLLGLLDVGLCA